ncbi:bifunctional oligoribonuclease/PAP phosphatase NrnA, partial [bacterium]|nr:bifunctional oligoribonuclease/PAP phosphatase NrnA [bacterium]
MNEEIHEKIRSLIKTAHHVVVLAHIRPDGDAVGSVLGLGTALKNAGKQVTFLLKDGVPTDYRFLSGSEEVVKVLPESFDLVIVCDSSDLQRTGGVLGNVVPDINIDHHITNLNYAKVNLVEPQQVATAALLAEHMLK